MAEYKLLYSHYHLQNKVGLISNGNKTFRGKNVLCHKIIKCWCLYWLSLFTTTYSWMHSKPSDYTSQCSNEKIILKIVYLQYQKTYRLSPRTHTINLIFINAQSKIHNKQKKLLEDKSLKIFFAFLVQICGKNGKQLSYLGTLAK